MQWKIGRSLGPARYKMAKIDLDLLEQLWIAAENTPMNTPQMRHKREELKATLGVLLYELTPTILGELKAGREWLKATSSAEGSMTNRQRLEMAGLIANAKDRYRGLVER